jgi:DNA repair protein RecO (recombination protein O)
MMVRQAPLRHFTISPLHHFTTSPLRHFTTSPLMLHNTLGIVLKTVKYGETSLIAKVYTQQFGLQSYMINSVRTTQSKHKAALLQPLSLLEMVVYHKKNKNIQHLKEIKPAYLFTQLPFDVLRSSLALFVSEILHKTLKEEEPNEQQFNFIYQFIVFLDQTPMLLANLHLVFLTELSTYIGFHPQNNFFYTERPIFDLIEGVFTHRPPEHLHYIELPLSEKLSKLLQTSVVESHHLQLSHDTRRQLLHALLHYYTLHIENFGETKSVPILEEIFNH